MLNPADHKPEWDLSAEFNVNLLSLANMKYIVSRDRLKAPNLKPVREIARPWHGLTTIEKIKTNFVENFTGRTSLFVYENTDVFPRIFFAESVRSFESATAVLNALKTANINELEQTVFLEKQHLPRVLAEKPLLGQGKIILRQYSPDKLDLDVEIADDALMVVTNGYSPYWSAEIDGQPADIFPVYHTFWGIHLPKSAKKITFKYEVPWDWQTYLFE